jgi:hypothetical protein
MLYILVDLSNISGESSASSFRGNGAGSRLLQNAKSTGIHSVTYVKKLIFIVTAVRTSNMFLVSLDFTWNASRKEELGRTRRSWEENVKILSLKNRLARYGLD